jgi:23S rRNA (adenine2503-C2)-methyltransferase
VPTLYDLDQAALAELLADQPRYRVDQVWHGLYQQAANSETGVDSAGGSIADVPRLTNVPKAVRARLAESAPYALTPVTESVSRDGDTVKWLWELDGGARIETVLMHYRDRSTVCVSTQAGCAMGCGFCATGQAGFERQLTVGEIVEQVVRARWRSRQRADPRRVSNIVFMGMGEPLANYDRMWGAVERLHDDMGISARHLTVSTVGVVPGIRRLADEALPVNLAVSLHAANDELRDEMVPINRRYPLAKLADACRHYLEAKGRRLSFEWAMIDGVNDRSQDATDLAAYASSLRAHVNLIPLNPTPGYLTQGTPPARVTAFRDQLRSLGVNATVRQNRGTDIDAACGQLRAGHAASPTLSRSSTTPSTPVRLSAPRR